MYFSGNNRLEISNFGVGSKTFGSEALSLEWSATKWSGYVLNGIWIPRYNYMYRHIISVKKTKYILLHIIESHLFGEYKNPPFQKTYILGYKDLGSGSFASISTHSL